MTRAERVQYAMNLVRPSVELAALDETDYEYFCKDICRLQRSLSATAKRRRGGPELVGAADAPAAAPDSAEAARPTPTLPVSRHVAAQASSGRSACGQRTKGAAEAAARRSSAPALPHLHRKRQPSRLLRPVAVAVAVAVGVAVAVAEAERAVTTPAATGPAVRVLLARSLL